MIAWGLCLFAAIACARLFGPVINGTGKRATASALLAISFGASLYLIWAHYRTMNQPWVFGMDHRFPYPDPAVEALLKWFHDRRPPLPPGSFNLHGVFPEVGFVLGLLILASVSLTGTLLGVLWNRPDGNKAQ